MGVTNGTAISQDHTSASNSNPPGLTELVASPTDNTYESARYRHGYVMGSRLTCTAIPQQRTASTADSYQDHIGLIVHKETNFNSEWVTGSGAVDTIRNNYNSLTQTPFTKGVILHQNPNGAPRGGNLAMGYSFGRMNGSTYYDDRNMFQNNQPPAEKDYFTVALVPFKVRDDMGTGADNTPIAPMDVHVTVSYICHLAQPQTMASEPQPIGPLFSATSATKRARIEGA